MLRRRRARRARLEAAGPPSDLGGGYLDAAGKWVVTAGGPAGPWTIRATPDVSRDDAMAVPTLAYIRNQMAGGIASMPLERYRYYADTDTDQKVPAGWCARPDLAPVIGPSLFWSWVIDDLLFSGKSTLIVLARDANGWPAWLRRTLPGHVIYDPWALAYGIGYMEEITYMSIPIPARDVIVINGPHEGVCNYGAVTIRQALDLEAASAQGAAEPLPNIDLHQTSGEPLTESKAQDLTASWAAARRQGATAYTPANIDAKPIGYSASDMQLTEGRQYMATQVARLAGVNPVLVSAAVGSSSSYVYTNQADYRQAFLDDVLDTYLQAIEGRLSADDVTPRGQYVRFDRDAYTRMPLSQRVEVFVAALKGGATPEMVNQLADVLELDFRISDTAVAPEPAAAL